MVDKKFVSLESKSAKANPVGFKPCQGLYYFLEGEQPEVAFIATHYNVDFSEHYLAPLLAAKGFGFLAWNTRYRGAEPYFILEQALMDIAAGVTWLREKASVTKVIILGNSGGGSLMAAYQSQARDPNIQPLLDMHLPEGIEDLPAADMYISLNAHGGRPEVLTDWMDPSVVDESDPLSVDESLNMYNPDNGPPYSADFIQRYRDGQKARNRKITDWVLAEVDRLAQRGVYERVFTLQRVWADLRMMDPSIDPSDREVGVCYAGDAKRANFDARGIGNCSSLRSWLSMWSLDYSPCRGPRHLSRIEVPALVVQSNQDTGVFPSDAKLIHDSLASKDKTLKIIDGDHYLTIPSQARTEVTGIISGWVKERL